MLHLNIMAVTGKTLGENPEDLKKNDFYEHSGSSWQSDAGRLRNQT